MNETTYLILQCGTPFIYKPGYYQVPNQLTPNTWNFIIMQNKKNNGCISLTKNMNDNQKKIGIKLSGKCPIDFNKLSKRKKGCVIKNRMLLCDLSSTNKEDEENLFNWLENRVAAL